MQNEYTKLRLLPFIARLRPRDFLASQLDVFLQLPDRILQRRARIIHLIHNEDSFPDEILHLPQRGEV